MSIIIIIINSRTQANGSGFIDIVLTELAHLLAVQYFTQILHNPPSLW